MSDRPLRMQATRVETRTFRTRPLAIAATAIAIAMASAGCDLAGIIADRTAGQMPVEARHTPDPTQPLVVLVENYRAPGSGTSDADRVARMIGQRLAEQKVAPIVEPEVLVRVRDRDAAAYRRMGVTQVGQATGAGQVLYVDLTSVEVGAQTGSDVAKGQASASVRLIDATTGLVAYPAETGGVPIAAETPLRRIGDGATPDTLRGEVLRSLSDRIARLFFSYKPDDLDAIGDDDMR